MSLPIFRIDDIGASTKYYNQHGQKWFTLFGKRILYFPFSNFWFFKRIKPFRKWAKYEELTKQEWETFLNIFEKHSIVPVVAITATWVDENSNLIPFHEKFPEEAEFLKDAFRDGKVKIANHGLTHCIVGKHQPRFFSSNRKFWREFYPWLDQEIHDTHIQKSQEILENFFEKPITIFVPPGNVWSIKTYNALKKTSVVEVMSARYIQDSDQEMDGISFRKDDDNVFAFHDRELKLFGAKWLLDAIARFR